MLLQIGTVLIEPTPRGASLDGLSRKTEAALADKGLLSGLPGHEWTGWSGEVTVSGTVLPFHEGGLGDIDALHGWCADGTRVPLIRGDGVFLGWFAIASVEDRHTDFARNGIGYRVEWTIALKRLSSGDTTSLDVLTTAAAALVDRVIGTVASTITSLFG